VSALAGTALRGEPAADEEVTEAVASLLGESVGGVRLLERRRSPYGSTFPIEELLVRRGDGSELRLILKDLGATVGATEPGPKPAFLSDPLREIETYRRVLGPAELSAPDCLGAVVDPPRDRYWLFLERIDGELLWQIGDPAVWKLAAQWLASMHVRFAGRSRPLPERLLGYDSRYYRRWVERMRRYVGEREARLDWLCARVEAAGVWLDSQPRTFLHGEFYPSNVIVERTGRGDRIRPVDWEMAGWGQPILDLAALVSGAWHEAERHALTEAYRSALPSASRPSAAALGSALDRCRLLLAVQWLGWSRHWTPPEQHENDWLAVALELAERTPASNHDHHPRTRKNRRCRG